MRSHLRHLSRLTRAARRQMRADNGLRKTSKEIGGRQKEREKRTGSGGAEIAGFIEWLKATQFPKA